MGWAMGAPSEDHTTPPSSRFFLLEEKSTITPSYNAFGSAPRQN